MIQSALFHLFGLRFLRYQRRFDRRNGFVGERAALLEVLENRSPLPIPWLRVESRISRHLQFGKPDKSDDHEINADMYHRSLFFLAGFSRITRRHSIQLRHRGYFSASSVAITSGDLFGFRIESHRMDTGAVIAVYPKLLSDSQIPSMCRMFLGNVLVKRYILPDPYLMNGVRVYQPGDTEREVNWRASARMGELCVNTHDFSADPCLMVVLNVQLQEHQWGDLSDVQMEHVEHSVSLAATLCINGLEGAAKVGFAANTDTKQYEHQCVFAAPARSSEQADALLTLFSQLTLRRTLNFYTFLSELELPEDADVLVLSPYSSDHIMDAMEALRLRGHNMLLQILEGSADHEAMSA